MEISGKTLDEFRKDFNDVMSVLQDKYDVSISLGPITYAEERFSAKLSETYAIVGFNTRAPRYPLEIIQISDGSRRKAGEGFIKELLNEYYVENLSQDQ